MGAMREHVLREFFLGRLDATALSRDLEGAIVLQGFDEAAVRVVDLEEGDDVVTTEQLVRVCDAVERGLLEAWKLEAIGVCLVFSDHFWWDATTPDGSRVARVLSDWAAPMASYPLTPRTVAKARHLLLTGEVTFTEDDLLDVPERAWPVRHVGKRIEKDPVPR